MQILNAKKSSLVLKLDNGEVLQIAPGKTSRPFIGTKTLLMAVVASGSPTEVGVIVSSPYELDMMRQVGASLSYLHNSEREAYEKLLPNGMPASAPAPVTPTAATVNAAKYEQEIERLNNEIRDLKMQIDDLSSNDEVNSLNEALDKATKEIVELRNKVAEANAAKDEIAMTVKDAENQVAEYKDQIVVLKKQLDEASTAAPAPEIDIESHPVVLQLKEQLATVTENYNVLTTNAKNAEEDANAVITSLNEQLEAAKGASAPELTAEQVEAINKYPQALAENQKLGEENVQLNLKAGRLEADLTVAKSEIDQLKADGKQLFDAYNAQKTELETAKQGYENAKAATLEIMNKFNISFVDGQWVQTM